jgi:tetratricopeptide (TPR) repeat protein
MINIKYLFSVMLVFTFMSFHGFGQTTANYDENISHMVKKIHQYPQRTKDLDALKENFSQANKIDLDRIQALRSTGLPDIWYEIYQAYTKLDNRQKTVMTIPEKSFQLLGIDIKDYKIDLGESKNKATAYFYAHAGKLLQDEKPESARQAYIELVKVAGMNGSYRDIDKLIRKSVLTGATNVEFEMYNRTGQLVSFSMIDQLSIIIWEFKKARYGQAKPAEADKSFAFTLRVILDDMKIGSDQVKDLQYQEERDLYQGETVVDTIRCLVSESRQLKKAQLTGSIEYFDPRIGQVINSVPIKVETVFSNAYATLQGDPNAAGDETRKLLNSKKAAYPSDEQMILTATEDFTKKAREIILAE